MNAHASPSARDPKALRALAHPVRWSIIEVLLAEDTVTASRCSAVLDEPVNSCSFHLRTLERHGFVERVPSNDGRERPWRLVEQRVTWNSLDVEPSDGDAARSAAATALDEMLIEREAGRQRTYLRRRSELSPEWQRAAWANGAYRWMTPTELADLDAAIEALFDRFRERHDPDLRPPGTRMVRLLGVALPMLPPEPALAADD